MKKKFSEIKHLLDGKLDESIGITDETELEVEWIEPQTLLTPARLDLPIKIKYIEAHEKGYDTNFFADMYDAHIRAFSGGSYTEPDKPEKNSIAKYFKIFHELIEEIKNNGLDENISLIPVTRGNVIVDGSHRTSCAIYFNKKVPIVRYPDLWTNFNSFFFEVKNLEPEYLDYATSVLVKLLNRPNFHVAIFWSRSDLNRLPQAEKILSEETEVIYLKTFQSDFNFTRNLVVAAYAENTKNSWLGRAEDGFPGADVKAFNCYNENGKIIACFFYKKPSTDILELKQKIRNIFQVGNDSVHITDTDSEAKVLMQILLNRNTTDLFKYGSPYKNVDLLVRLKNFYNAIHRGGDFDDSFIIDSSSVLGLYGLRNVGDVDYITNSAEKIFPREVGDNHNGYLYFHETSADDLIFNPRNYLYFEGMKVVSLEQVAHMKKMRRVGDVGKDLMDILLTGKIFSKRLETLNGAVMEFISYLHSAKNFNFDQLFGHLEPIFSQEGWRAKNFLREEEKILVICNYVCDDIVGMNNFLKNIREQKPTAKITFLTDVRSQKLVSNLKCADKIISLDTTFEQDTMWQICKFVELCRNCLWREYFSTCYMLNLENNFALTTLFGYLSGACQRIGYFSSAEKAPKDIQNSLKFFSQLFVVNA